ncbi:COG2426 family protein [Alkalithermobacter paradoxus]|uniref:Putative small multi-drug export protein n=1 Tax=Alkalithermobacter paradoxus TaxID=29349 RepID=A0A1V4I615_9FIRM|nr:putative small multi-drug export protein [[Clostridium] thermoalcaliphilum]
METFLKEVINFLTIEITVLLTAAMPIIELRGAIPVGISLGMSPLHATIISFLGSMIPVPFILFAIRPIFNAMKKTKLLSPIVDKLSSRSMSKNSHKIQKYGAWALIPLVAIPLPGTGVWSASLGAALLDIRFKWAFPAILVGNLMAAILIMTLSDTAFRFFV